jgi:predicted aldo/keto reductase-like oxidoreductase
VNHIDTAMGYGDAELRIGPWMAEHRDTFFLATKSGKRTREEAWADLQSSLRRLQVDYVDLWQMHGLHDAQDWEVAMGPGGALEAFVDAREQGLARFLGVTGHGAQAPATHLRSLGRFEFDSVLMPCNYPMMQNRQYAADFDAVVSICRERNVAVQTIKSICRKPWGKTPRTRTTWYRPLEEQADIDRAVGFVLGKPGIFLNTVADMHLLPNVLDAATRFEAGPSDEAMHAMADALQMEPLFI